MEAGQLEVLKALEDVQVRNIEAVIQYVQDSRKLILKLHEENKALYAEVHAQRALLEQFKIQLAGLQTKVYSKGS